MKKFLYLGLMALMMLFAVPNVWAQDSEGEEPTTPETTLPTPTFTPSTGSVEQGSMIVFDLPTGDAYLTGFVAFCYAFDNATAELKPTFEEMMAVLYGGGEDEASESEGDAESSPDYYIAGYMSGNSFSQGIIPLDMETGEHTMRVRMAFIADMNSQNPEVTYSEVESATYTVTAVAPATQPVFSPETGTALSFAGTFALSFPQSGEETEDDSDPYWIYYVVDNADFDFSNYTTEADIKQAGAKQATIGGNIRLTKGAAIKAAACKVINAENSTLFGWSEPVSATYTMNNPSAPVITPASGGVTVGDKAVIKSNDNNTTSSVAPYVDIYYTIDGTEPSTSSTKGVYISNAKKEIEVEITGAMTLKAIAVGKDDPTLISTVAEAIYTLPAEPEELETPVIRNAQGMPAGQGGYVAKGAKIAIVGPDEEDVVIWYTVDGVDPVINGATATEDSANMAYIQIDSTMTIKAIAVKGSQSSEVVSATFKLADSLKDAVVVINNENGIFGKNVPFMFGVASEEYPAMGESLSAFVYTLDGTTEPTMEAYEAQEDKENGVIKALEFGWPVFFPMESSMHMKVRGYALLSESIEDGWFTTAVLDTVLTVESETNPVITVDREGELEEGDTIVIKNASEARGASVYFSLDGTPITSTFFDYDEEILGKKVFFFDEEIKIAIEYDEANVSYAAVFEAQGEEQKVYLKSPFKVQAICYSAGDFGSGQKGSDNVTATYTIKEKEAKKNPKLSVAIATNGTMGTDDVVTFNGPAAFKVTVNGIAEDDDINNYTINAEIYGEDFFNPVATVSEEAAGADKMELLGLYNGEYEVNFYLERKADPDIQQSVPEPLDVDTIFNIKVTNYAEPELIDPSFEVSIASNGTMANNVVTFDSIAGFRMKVGEMSEGDSLKISAELWKKADYENNAPMADVRPLTTYSYDVTDTVAEFLGVYNGEYVVVFSLDRYSLLLRDYASVRDSVFTFTVTHYAEPEIVDPTFAVTSAGNGKVDANKVVTFDGAAKFMMAVGEMSEADSLKISAEIWTKEAYNDLRNGKALTMNSYEATDTVAEFLGVYNGEYVVVFSLDRYSLMLRDYSTVRDTTITFTVTNYEEELDKYELTVKAVGATMTKDTAAFAGKKAAFDLFAANYTNADTLVATIYTPAQFADTLVIKPSLNVVAADSVRFEATLENDGLYIALFEMKHTDAKKNITTTVRDTVLYFTVKTTPGTAVEAAELAGVNVYPNPSNGTFNVAVPEKARIDIFGLNGAKVMSREANAGVETFSINHSGIYFVRVMAGNKTAVKRVVVR